MSSDEKTNVISLETRRKNLVVSESTGDSELDEIIRKNKENEERMRKERIKSNLSVLKSYRIKKT